MTADKVFYDVEVYSISRLNNSNYGNPRYKMETSEGVFKTQPDAMLGYGLENFTNSRRPETHLIGNPGKKVDLVGSNRDSIHAFQIEGETIV